MDEKLVEKLSLLKTAIINSKEYQEFIEIEKKLTSNEEVMVLSYKKDMALVEYEDGLKHYSKNSQELININKNLAEATYNLNNHPLVKEYKKKLDALNKLYLEVENIIYKGIK
ncbi:MAG: YlbF family regulator [Candidatus Onthovivens sp.]|nr:YlbF family regulator [Candidatus Onthovivens sp.]